MFIVSNYVKSSPIHGIGVFAGEDIPIGSLVWEYVTGFDQEIGIDNLPTVIQQYIKDYGNVVKPGSYLICGDNARFMNHSDSPNISGANDKNYALRDIMKGEEITVDYRDFDTEFNQFS